MRRAEKAAPQFTTCRRKRQPSRETTANGTRGQRWMFSTCRATRIGGASDAGHPVVSLDGRTSGRNAHGGVLHGVVTPLPTSVRLRFLGNLTHVAIKLPAQGVTGRAEIAPAEW